MDELRYRVVVSQGTVYIVLPATDVGIAPTIEEWQVLKERVDRLIMHDVVRQAIKESDE
jgi:hypothetical protein